jgi:hypothetical protein
VRRLLPAALLLLALGATACGDSGPAEPERDASGAVASAGAVDPFEVKLGDCVDEPVSSTDEVEEVESVKAVPCDSPHDGEVYAVFDLPDGDFPGDEEVATAGEERCVEEFATFVGTPYDDSEYDITSLFPTKQSWEEKDDREYVCIVVAPEGEQVTGTLKGKKG